MLKLILITLIVLIPTPSCYANLSLASNEAPLVEQPSLASNEVPQTLVEQPKSQTTQVRPDATIKHRTAIKHSTTVKHPKISRPVRVHQREQNLRTQWSYEPSHKHCF